MKRSRRTSIGRTTAFLMLASLLVLIGLALGACRSEESSVEPAPPPADTPASVETPAAEPSEAPAGGEITITGKMPPPAWDKKEVSVGVGDTIVWKIGNGKHSVEFSDPAACQAAEEKMTFDPLLVNCKSGEKQTSGEVIVRAKVNQALDGPLSYRCGVHTSMAGVLKPK